MATDPFVTVTLLVEAAEEQEQVQVRLKLFGSREPSAEEPLGPISKCALDQLLEFKADRPCTLDDYFCIHWVAEHIGNERLARLAANCMFSKFRTAFAIQTASNGTLVSIPCCSLLLPSNGRVSEQGLFLVGRYVVQTEGHNAWAKTALTAEQRELLKVTLKSVSLCS